MTITTEAEFLGENAPEGYGEDFPEGYNKTYETFLNTPLYFWDVGEEMTPRRYLADLLVTLIYEGEGFSGKRPFGNSGREGNFGPGLLKLGIIPGKIEPYGDDGEVDYDFDQRDSDNAMKEIINYMIIGGGQR